MNTDSSRPFVAPADYYALKEATRLSAQFAASARMAITCSGRNAEMQNALTQDEAADAQYIEWKLGHLPRRTDAENATYDYFLLSLCDLFAEGAVRANIDGLENHIPPEMATREMVQFLTRHEKFALAFITMEAAP